MELFEFKLSNKKSGYVVAEDDGYARDKVHEWIKDRFFADSVSIDNLDQVAETKTKGLMKKLIL